MSHNFLVVKEQWTTSLAKSLRSLVCSNSVSTEPLLKDYLGVLMACIEKSESHQLLISKVTQSSSQISQVLKSSLQESCCRLGLIVLLLTKISVVTLIDCCLLFVDFNSYQTLIRLSVVTGKNFISYRRFFKIWLIF